MLASLILYFDQYETAVQVVSTMIEFPKAATEVLPLLIGGAVAAVVLGWVVFEAVSRIQSFRLREAAKPVINK